VLLSATYSRVRPAEAQTTTKSATSCCCVSATQSSSTTKYSADNDELYTVNTHLLDAAYCYTSSVVCLSVCVCVCVGHDVVLVCERRTVQLDHEVLGRQR